MDRKSNNTSVILIVGGLIACLCVCALATAGGAMAFLIPFQNAISTSIVDFPTDLFVTSEGPDDATPTIEPEIVLTPIPTPLEGSSETLEVLEAEEIPQSDLREIAMRLLGVPDVPVTVSDVAANHEVGTELPFFMSNTDTGDSFEITARLVYKSENVYFFAENGVDVDEAGVQALVDNFQENTYPTNREFFGEEWNPGVDGDPHLYIVYARGLGENLLGYYSSADEYSRLAHEFSNEKELFAISADNTGPDDPSLPGTLAHEFQHMIHWNHDRNEETWMNEGSSVMAELLNGYGADGFDFAYIIDTDVQLTTWVDGDYNQDTSPHYGAGFLFMTYFLDRFDNEATQALVADPGNGMRAVDDVLTQFGLTDPATGDAITAVDVFADWVVANYLGDPDVADGRYEYHNYPDAPTVEEPMETFNDCSTSHSATVFQFAADYYDLDCGGEVTVRFTGSQQVQVVDTEPHSGRYAFWSHRNDESDTRMLSELDLSGVDAATLNYWTWYELEEDYDYVYLVVSTDGGETWSILETPSGTGIDPTGNNLGWGYTGFSGDGTGDWIEESVDLSAYAGQVIQVGFEYVTDAAYNYAGLLVDDISVPEIGYTEDFEAGDGSWLGEGFVRIDNLLPQEFVVQVISGGSETTVQRMELDDSNTGTLTFSADGGATLVVSGITPFTNEPASYEFTIE